MLLKVQLSSIRKIFPQTQCPIMKQSFSTCDLITWEKEVCLNSLKKIYLMVKSSETLDFMNNVIMGNTKGLVSNPPYTTVREF